jgi:hypothetical protein
LFKYRRTSRGRRPLRPVSQVHDHAQDQPAVSAIRHGLAAAGQEWIVMHADTEHAEAAFACQRVVERDAHRASGQEAFDDPKHGKSQDVQRPGRLGKLPMKRGVMALVRQPWRDQHPGDRAAGAKTHPCRIHRKLRNVGAVITMFNSCTSARKEVARFIGWPPEGCVSVVSHSVREALPVGQSASINCKTELRNRLVEFTGGHLRPQRPATSSGGVRPDWLPSR